MGWSAKHRSLIGWAVVLLLLVAKPCAWAQGEDGLTTSPKVEGDCSKLSGYRRAVCVMLNLDWSNWTLGGVSIIGTGLLWKGFKFADRMTHQKDAEKLEEWAKEVRASERTLMRQNQFNNHLQYSKALDKAEKRVKDLAERLDKMDPVSDEILGKISFLSEEIEMGEDLGIHLQNTIANLKGQLSEEDHLNVIVRRRLENSIKAFEKKVVKANKRVEALRKQLTGLGKASEVYLVARQFEQAAIEYELLKNPPIETDATKFEQKELLDKWPALSTELRKQLNELHKKRGVLENLISELLGYVPDDAELKKAVDHWRKGVGTRPVTKWLDTPAGQAFLQTNEGQTWKVLLDNLNQEIEPKVNEVKALFNAKVFVHNRPNQNVQSSRSKGVNKTAALLESVRPDKFEGGQMSDPLRFHYVGEQMQRNDHGVNVDARPQKSVQFVRADSMAIKLIGDKAEDNCTFYTEKLAADNKHRKNSHLVTTILNHPAFLYPTGLAMLAASQYAYWTRKASIEKAEASKAHKDAALGGMDEVFKQEHASQGDRINDFTETAYKIFTEGFFDPKQPNKNLAEQVHDQLRSTVTHLPYIFGKTTDQISAKEIEVANAQRLWANKKAIQDKFESAMKEESANSNKRILMDNIYRRSQADAKQYYVNVFKRAMRKIYVNIADDYIDGISEALFSKPEQTMAERMRKSPLAAKRDADEMELPGPSGSDLPTKSTGGPAGVITPVGSNQGGKEPGDSSVGIAPQDTAIPVSPKVEPTAALHSAPLSTVVMNSPDDADEPTGALSGLGASEAAGLGKPGAQKER